MHRPWTLGLAVLAGCGDAGTPAPEPEPTALFEEVCGTEGPRRLLPLAEGEHAYRLDPLAQDDRVLVSTFFVDPSTPLAQFPPTLDLAIYAVEPCGDTAVPIAAGLSLTSGHDGLLFGCDDDDHGVYLLDPSGAQPPRLLLEGWCPLRSTAAGLVTVQAEPAERHGTLVVLRDPADPAAQPEVLASDLRVPRNAYFGPGGNATTSLWTDDHEAVGLDHAGVVARVDLSTGDRTDELSGVRELRISGDARLMIWQALDPAEGDPSTPVGPVFLRDREAQTDTHLLNTHLEWTGNPYAGEYLVIRDDRQGPRVFYRDGQPIALPSGTHYRGVLADGQLWLARRVDDQTEELRWTPGDPTPTVITRHGGQVSPRSDGMEIFEDDDAAPPNEGSLHFVPWDGGEPAVLADHVHQSRRALADGRILSIVYEDAHHHGSLRLSDPDTGGWIRIDPRGYVQSPRLGRHDPFDGDIVFSTSAPDLDDTRRGVYRARVPRSGE